MKRWIILACLVWIVHFHHPHGSTPPETGSSHTTCPPKAEWVHEVYVTDEKPTLYRSHRSGVWSVRADGKVVFLPVGWTWIEKVVDGD